jgi:hypothetical protein
MLPDFYPSRSGVLATSAIGARWALGHLLERTFALGVSSAWAGCGTSPLGHGWEDWVEALPLLAIAARYTCIRLSLSLASCKHGITFIREVRATTSSTASGIERRRQGICFLRGLHGERA